LTEDFAQQMNYFVQSKYRFFVELLPMPTSFLLFKSL
jgi:hypothetical protein